MPEAIAAICAGGFILVLALAAYWNPTTASGTWPRPCLDGIVPDHLRAKRI